MKSEGQKQAYCNIRLCCSQFINYAKINTGIMVQIRIKVVLLYMKVNMSCGTRFSQQASIFPSVNII